MAILLRPVDHTDGFIIDNFPAKQNSN